MIMSFPGSSERCSRGRLIFAPAVTAGPACFLFFFAWNVSFSAQTIELAHLAAHTIDSYHFLLRFFFSLCCCVFVFSISPFIAYALHEEEEAEVEEEKARPKKDKNKTETKCSGKTSANTTKERGGGGDEEYWGV